MTDVEVLDMLFSSTHGILDQLGDSKSTGDSTANNNNMLFTTDDQLPSTDNFLSWPSPLGDDLGNYSDDFLNSLLDTNLDDDSKKQQIKLSDHDYSVVMPNSPLSDSGVSSGPYSPGSNNSSTDDLLPLDIEKELFGPLDLQDYEMADQSNLMPIDPALIETFSDTNSTPDSTTSTNNVEFDFDFGKLLDNGTSDRTHTVTTSLDGSTKVIKVVSLDTRPNQQSLLPLTVNKETTSTSTGQYPELRLTLEEKDLMEKEGLSIPTNMPLTREEEKLLRSIRRRIRNKASARNSRRKKQDYMEQMEQRIRMSADEKRKLEKKITHLEKQNSSLIGQLKRLQHLVADSTKQTARAGTCAMILALSFCLVLFPNFPSYNGSSPDTTVKSPPMAGRSRSLLNVLPSKDDVSTNYLPFVNFDKVRSYIPGGNLMVDEPVDGVKGERYMVDEDVEDIDYTVVQEKLLKIEPQVIHMEITKIADVPTVKTPPNNFTGDEHNVVVNRRNLRMDIEDHDEL